MSFTNNYVVSRITGPAVRIEAANLVRMAEQVQSIFHKDHIPMINKRDGDYFMQKVDETNFSSLKTSDNILAIFDDEDVSLAVKDVNRGKQFKIKKLSYGDAVEEIKALFSHQKAPTIVLDDIHLMVTDESFLKLQPNVELVVLFDEEQWISKGLHRGPTTSNGS